MIRPLAGMLGLSAQTDAYADELAARVEEIRDERIRLEKAGALRPRVYFEEWENPMISGIGWFSELIGIAGGEQPPLRDQVTSDPSTRTGCADGWAGCVV